MQVAQLLKAFLWQYGVPFT